MADGNQAVDLDLIARIRAGDAEAREQLVQKYLPMVRHIVRNYYASFLDYEDLLQEGLIGLLSAIDEYRPEDYNVKFSSFAYICIIRKVYNVIKQSNGNKHRALNDALSLHAAVSPGEGRTVLDLCPDASQPDPLETVEDKLAAQEIQQLLRQHLSLLEYTVASFLLQGYTARDIEGLIGITAKVVDNARTRVKGKLRRMMAEYGSLCNPHIPRKARRRKDLCLDLRVG